MDKITYSIVSRGELLIKFGGKSIRITGELTFNPPKFYADLISLEKIEGIDNKDKREIMAFIKNDSLKNNGTEIFFD